MFVIPPALAAVVSLVAWATVGNFASEVSLVFFSALLVTSLCIWGVHAFRAKIMEDAYRLLVPYVCALWSLFAVALTVIAVVLQGDPADGLFTTKTWFSAGWNTGLSIFSVKVNTWWRYLILIIYQIVRSILGSLLTNAFRSYITVNIQSGGGRKADPGDTARVVSSQLAYNFFIYYSSLTDSYIMLSQLDLTIITTASTMLTDALSTIYFMSGDVKVHHSALPEPDGTTAQVGGLAHPKVHGTND